MVLYINNLKKNFYKSIHYFVYITFIISIFNFIFNEKSNFIYEIKILNVNNTYLYDEKEKFILFSENLEKIYEKEIPIKYKECKSKYLQKINNLNYNNLIFNCFDKNIIFLEYASNTSRIFIYLNTYNEEFNKKLNQVFKIVKNKINLESNILKETVVDLSNNALLQNEFEKYLLLRSHLKKITKEENNNIFQIVQDKNFVNSSLNLKNYFIIIFLICTLYITLILIISVRKIKNVR
jgi:hypothetical protein